MKNVKELKKSLLLEAAGHCLYCGRPLTAEYVRISRINPYGNAHFRNLACCCDACLAAKGGMSAREFRDSMPPGKKRKYVRRLESLFVQGKLPLAKWDALDPVRDCDDIPSANMSVREVWLAICLSPARKNENYGRKEKQYTRGRP